MYYYLFFKDLRSEEMSLKGPVTLPLFISPSASLSLLPFLGPKPCLSFGDKFLRDEVDYLPLLLSFQNIPYFKGELFEDTFWYGNLMFRPYSYNCHIFISLLSYFENSEKVLKNAQ